MPTELASPQISWPAGIRLPVVLTFEHQSGEGAVSMPGNRPNYRTADTIEDVPDSLASTVLEALDENSIKATFLVSGFTAEKYPETIRAAPRAGHEVAGLGYSFEPIYTASMERERSIVRRTVASLREVTGACIQGWRCPDYRVSPQTHDILAEEGFVWDSSLLNDDLPYLLASGARRIVEIPFTTSTADKTFVGDPPPQRGGPDGLANVWDSEFALLYEESKQSPRFLILAMQTWATGRPVILRVLKRLLKRVASTDGIWFARCSDLARLCNGHADTLP